MVSATTSRTNPIASAELNRQHRLEQRRLWRVFKIAFFLVLGAAFLLSLSLYLFTGYALQSIMHWSTWAAIRDLLLRILSVAQVVIFISLLTQHILMVSQAVQSAATTIAREKAGRTWESLLLTNVTARQIVLGKWWATLRNMWQMHRWMFWWRALAVLWLCLLSIKMIGTVARADIIFHISLSPRLIVVAVFVALLYVIVHIGLAAALGVLVSLFARAEATAYRLAVAVHFGFIVLSIMGFAGVGSLYMPQHPLLRIGLAGVLLSPLDGGAFTVFNIFNRFMEDPPPNAYLGSALVCIVLYVTLTFALLFAAEKIAIRQRALPPT